MKVLHAAETIKGGVATVLKQIVYAQTNSNLFSEVYCLIPENQKSEMDIIPRKNLISFHRTGRNITSLVNFLRSFIKNVYVFNPDVVHLHSTFAGFLGRAALLILYPIRKPAIIYCPHAFSFLMEDSNLKKRLFIIIEKILLFFTNKVICVSHYERNIAIQYGLSEKKMVVVYNGVAVKDEVKKVEHNGTFNLLFVGRLDYQKGYDILINAMSSLENEDVHLKIVGDSVNQNSDKVYLKNVSYEGWISSNKLEPYYLHADALVISSRWEGFAMVPLEAMSYYLPIIASDSTSLPEVVDNMSSGLLFENGNSDDLKNKILALKSSDYQTLGRYGNQYFRKKFTSDLMIEKTFEIYKNIIIK